MACFRATLDAWEDPAFGDILRRDVAACQARLRHIAERASASGCLATEDLAITLLGRVWNPDGIHIRIGVFFRTVLAGCSCGDEPSMENGYCEVRITIDGTTAEGELWAAS